LCEAFAQNCSQLRNGTYRIEYDYNEISKDSYPKNIYEIVNGKCFVTFENGERKEFDIIKFGVCSFRLESNEILDTTNFTPLQKVLSMQRPYFDILKTEGNQYYFIFKIDLHVRSFSGRFLRMKD